MILDESVDLHVHKHLLSKRSELFKADVDVIEDGEYDWSWSNLDLKATSQYVGSLYGQPMWSYAPGANINVEWCTLNELYHFSTNRKDFDAADACIDGMREMLEGWRGDLTYPFVHLQFFRCDFGAPCGRILLDYMVHRSCDIKRWIDDYELYCDPGSLQDALSKKFAEEAQRKKDKTDRPDLMQRCRYHLHVKNGLPCDLDK